MGDVVLLDISIIIIKYFIAICKFVYVVSFLTYCFYVQFQAFFTLFLVSLMC